MIYNLVFLSTAFANLLTYLSFKARKNAYYVMLALLFAFVTFRWDVGCDWGGYLNQSNYFGERDFGDAFARSEPAYWATLILLHRFGFDYPAINVVASISFFAGIHSIARRQPDPLLYLTLSFPILMTGIAMSAVRQEFAMGFVCFAFNAFADKKVYRYIIWCLIGAQFHKSAYSFILLTPLLFNIGRQYKILALLLALPIVVFLARSDAAETYAGMYVGSGAQNAAGGPFRALILFITGGAFVYFLKPQWKKYSLHDFDFVNSMIPVMMAMFPISFFASVVGDRVGYYIAPIAYIIQAKSYLLLGRKNALAAFWLPMLVGGLVLFVYTQYSWIFQDCYMPYQSWWTVDPITRGNTLPR